jgi:hypothetical protein
MATEEAPDNELHAIQVDDPILGAVDEVVEPPVDSQLDLLPTNLLRWEDFERLLLDLGKAELALRSLRYYGARGQAQKGLDLVGINPERKAEGIQAKQVQSFTVANLDAAVEKFTSSTVPFELVRFVVGVSTPVPDRKVADRLIALNNEHGPLEIEIWDQSQITDMLRGRPELVIKYFGPRAAERFCPAYVVAPVEIPGPDAVATADAVVRGPLRMADAQELLNRAKGLVTDEPAAALELYREVQTKLASAGFPGHAAEFDDTVAALSIRTGDEGAAIRLLFDALWVAERAGDSRGTGRVVQALRGLAGFSEIGPIQTEAARTPTLGAAFELADFVDDLQHEPTPTPVKLPAEAIALADAADRARTVLVAAEHALANDDLTWITSHQEQIESAAAEIAATNDDVAVRLRLTVADATGDWAGLIRIARSAMRRDLKALALARHARYQALQSEFKDADDTWTEAIGDACLAKRHKDAADWLYSQRYIASRYLGILEDQWHPVARALTDLPTQPKLVTTANDSRERALAALHFEEPRVGAINLRRQLLDGIRSASFYDELEARQLLGQAYCATGNRDLAAYYSIHGGDYKAARAAAAAFGDSYHDVTEFMKGPLSWVVASALQFASEQADLIPDDALDAVAELAFAAINDAMSGARVESPILSPQMYLSAYGLLAALAERLSETHAQAVLEMLSDAVVVEEHHYRRTDESHVEIAAGIARARDGELHTIALDQLVGLYARGVHPLRSAARDTLVANLDVTRDRLQAMADQGHHEAAALIGYSDPDRVSPEAAEAAARRLCAPTTNGPGCWGTGTGAVNDSLLAAVLSVDERVACIEMLMSNAASPWEGSSNRDSYLVAASNLVDELDEEHRRKFFDAAVDFAAHPPVSNVDAFNASMRNPLGGMRVNDRSDSRPAAAFLAARLAKSPEEKRLVRDSALRLIGVGTDEDYRVTTALQLVEAELGDSAALLAQGGWTLRSLAAILWAKSTELPKELGMTLSLDRDVRVRRTLARELCHKDDERSTEIRAVLEADRRWSVRSIARSRGVQGG